MTKYVTLEGLRKPVSASQAIVILAKRKIPPAQIAARLKGLAELSSIYTRISQARSRGVAIPKFSKWA